jgi:hypothetical protein
MYQEKNIEKMNKVLMLQGKIIEVSVSYKIFDKFLRNLALIYVKLGYSLPFLYLF